MTTSASGSAPMPARDAEGASAIIAATLNVSRDGANVAAAVEFFTADLRSNEGLPSILISSPARIAIACDALTPPPRPRDAPRRRLHLPVVVPARHDCQFC